MTACSSVLLTAALAALAASTTLAATVSPGPPDPLRVAALAKMLPETPRGVGPCIGDRQSWGAAARAPGFKEIVAQAEEAVGKPLPALTDAFFIECARIADRKRCGPVLSARHGRFPLLTLAECLENRGRFLPAIEEAIRALCTETTWMHPAHDRGLRNVKGVVTEIDLSVSSVSWNLATAYYWLGDKLSPATRQLVREELDRRTFRPFELMVTEGKPRMWWLSRTSNWNAVCIAGVTGAALAVIENRERRAFFLASAEKYIRNFLSGFTPQGFCSEGLGYWNYGFGRFTMLAEAVHQATGGKVNWLEDPHVRQVALFPRRMEILPGVYPAFADCNPKARPGARLTAFLSRRFGMGLKDIEAEGLGLAGGPSTRLFEMGLFGFTNAASRMPAADRTTPPPSLRDWFPVAGCLICRPRSAQLHALGVAIKGGNNAEHHNHNDVGTFVVALGQGTPLVDPGAENYFGRTFSARRYESNVLNSFGHSVPRVAGQLQRTGPAARAEVVKTDFADEVDTLVLDLSSAYEVKALKTLQRTFVFAREDGGRLTVIDEVEFKTPQPFGTALITFCKWRRSGTDGLIVGEGQDVVRVHIAAKGPPVQVAAEQIKEDLPGNCLPTRLGIDLAEPAAKATITLTIVPLGERRKESGR